MENKAEEQKQAIELFDPTSQKWEDVKDEVWGIENSAFNGKGFTEERLKTDFEKRENTVFLIRNPEGKLIGYGYGMPDPDETDKSARIESIAILPEYQGHGLASDLMPKLESQLKNNGYEFITGYYNIANGFAEKIRKNYENRIIKSEGPIDKFGFGSQMFYKIRL